MTMPDSTVSKEVTLQWRRLLCVWVINPAEALFVVVRVIGSTSRVTPWTVQRARVCGIMKKANLGPEHSGGKTFCVR